MDANQRDFFPWDDNVPETDILETGFYQIQGVEMEDTFTQDNPRRMLVVRGKFTAPPEVAGQSTAAYFVVGTEESPDEVVKGTRGFKRLQRLLYATQIPNTGSLQMMMSTVGNWVWMEKIRKFTFTRGEKKGQTDNSTDAYMKIGVEIPRIVGDGMPGGGVTVTAPALVGMVGPPMQAPAPIVAPPAQMAPPVVQAAIEVPPVPTLAPAPMATVQQQMFDPMTGQPIVPQGTPTPPQATTATQLGAMPMTPVQTPLTETLTPPSVTPGGGIMVPCSGCEQQVDSMQLMEHVRVCPGYAAAR